MKYFIVDAFTNQPFVGNPAGVALLDGDTFPNDELMLKVAAELRYSETAFVKRHSGKEYTVRYFTPKAEVELCGHVTPTPSGGDEGDEGGLPTGGGSNPPSGGGSGGDYGDQN